MSDNGFPTRVQYSDRQFLQAADLRADQAYHRAARWRHNLALHSWGVLAGLDAGAAGADPSTTAVTVTAGMALDGYGRELVVRADASEPQALDRTQSYDVWLVYRESTVPPQQPKLRAGCAATAAASRVEESPRLLVTKTADRRSPSPSRPDGVPVGDLEFGPDRPAPPAGQGWPVFLARLDFRADSGGELAWAADASERRYAGLVADRIVAPPRGRDQRDRTVVLTGADPDNPDLRFAVASCGASGSKPDPPFLAVRAGPDGADARIELRSDRVTVAGDMLFRDGSALQFEANPISPTPGDVHAKWLSPAEQWRVYHHFTPPDLLEKPPVIGVSQPPPEFSDELRITMPALPAGANQVAIGYFGDKGKFVPVLAVRDKSVEVYGTLTVVGGEITGKFTKVPAGTATGGSVPITKDVIQAAVGKYVSVGGTTFSDILKPILFKPAGRNATASAMATVDAPDDKQVQELFASLWGKKAELIAQSIFDPAEVRAGDLVKGMPESYENTDQAINEFAEKLWQDGERLGALIDALVEKSANAPTDAARRAVAMQLAGWVGKNLAPSDGELETQTTKSRREAEDSLTESLVPLFGGLLDGGNGSIRTRALVGLLLDNEVGMEVIAPALGKGIFESINMPSDTNLDASARLSKFFKHIVSQADIVNASIEGRQMEFTLLKFAMKHWIPKLV